MPHRSHRDRWLFAVVFGLAAIACGGQVGNDTDRAIASESSSSDRGPVPVAGATLPRVVILGDSLTAGYGLPLTQAFPTALQDRLNDAGLPYTVVNAGQSGDTSAGGLARLEWALSGNVRVLVIALGGNDALRGLPTEELERNLSTIIERAQARDISVILAGMEAPPNYGFEYTRSFHAVYPSLAKQYNVALVPFLLEGVAGITALNQPDGIHPTADGARIVADNVWAVLAPILEVDSRRVARGRAPGR
jgi:acyl-CoA thioesterase-1